MHWPQPDTDIEEAWSAVAEFVKEGKVRYTGVSNFSVTQLKRIQPIHPVASVQPPYSMFVRGAEDELLPYCAAHRIGVVAYGPLQKGSTLPTNRNGRAALPRSRLLGLRRRSSAALPTIGSWGVSGSEWNRELPMKRSNCRQVLDCGDGVSGVAALVRAGG